MKTITILLLVAMSPLGFSDEQSPPPGVGDAAATACPNEAQVQELIDQLGSASWAVREAAEKRLRELDERAVASLLAAKHHQDPEIRSRAARILKAIHRNHEVQVKILAQLEGTTKGFRPHLSPSGDRLAYQTTKAGKEILVCDGKPGPAWDSICYVGPFSKDGKRLPYQARNGERNFILFAGEEDQPIPMQGNGRAFYSPNCDRIAYPVSGENKSWIVCDGQELPHYTDIHQERFVRGGQHLAYLVEGEDGECFFILNGQDLKSYEGVSSLVLSPDGKHRAYIARRANDEVIVHDGKEGKAYDEVLHPMFAPKGNNLAYWTRSSDNSTYNIVFNERVVVEMKSEPQLRFSCDGKKLAWGSWSGESVSYYDGQTVTQVASGYDAASKPTFSRDGRHLCYAAGKDFKYRIYVDKQPVSDIYDATDIIHFCGFTDGRPDMRVMILRQPVSFSADGRHVYYVGTRDEDHRSSKQFILCDGFEGPEHDAIWIPDHYKNHADRLRYVARDGTTVRLMEYRWPQTLTWQDAAKTYRQKAK